MASNTGEGGPADINDLNPEFASRVAKFRAALQGEGINTRIVSGYRSPELQQKLYDNYQAKLAGRAIPYPQEGSGNIAAQPWQSYHNYGLAADILPSDMKDYPRMVALAKNFGITDIGPKDIDHFQMAGNLPALIQQYHLQGWRPGQNGQVPVDSSTAASAVAAASPAASVAPPAGYKAIDMLPVPPGETLPMGMGNNNPANIKFFPGLTYKGIVGPSKNTDQGDPQIVFSSPQAGMDAAYQLASKKYNAGMTTPAMIIAGEKGWTPGNMQAAKNIAATAGIGVDDDIGFTNPLKAQKFMRALITQEQGGANKYYPDSMIYQSGLNSAAPTTEVTSAGTTTPSGTTIPTATAPSGTTIPTATAPDQQQQPKSTLDILTGKTGPQKNQPSPLEQLGSALGITGQKQMQQSQVPQMQFQAPPARNVGMLEGAGPSLMAQVQENAAKPLSWGSQPGQAGGMQAAGPTPGTTLNSMPQMPSTAGWGYYGSPMGFSGFSSPMGFGGFV